MTNDQCKLTGRQEENEYFMRSELEKRGKSLDDINSYEQLRTRYCVEVCKVGANC